MRKISCLSAFLVITTFAVAKPLPVFYSSKAYPWNFHITMQENSTGFNFCTGEMMQYDITIEWINTGVENKNRLVSVWNLRIFGTAVGLSTGNVYTIREHQNSTFTMSLNNGLLVFPLQHKWWMRSKGQGQDFSGEISWMYVLNAKGEEVVNTFNWRSDCE